MSKSLFDEIMILIAKCNPMQKKFLEASIAEMSDVDKNALYEYISYCKKAGISENLLAQSYCTIVTDTLREQIYFQRHGKYRYSSYEEVANSVYLNDRYMLQYMHGLALTTYLWPNHRAIHQFFETVFPSKGMGSYLEIGPGHGVYFRSAVKRGGFTKYIGVDISPTSIALTRGLLERSCPDKMNSIELQCRNFLDAEFSVGDCQAIVMGEVLEHVENPLAFMQKISQLISKKGFLYITTAINSPAIDHIYLFRSADEISEIVFRAGFRISQQLLVPYGTLSIEESMSARLPVNIALLMEKLP